MRRIFLKILLTGLLGVSVNLGAALPVWADEPIKVVYHLSDGIEQASRALGNIRNHLRGEPNTKIVVVALGDGIQFLLNDAKDRSGKPFDTAVAALVAQGVEFRVCNNTLTAHGIPASGVLSQAKIVPSGVVEIARLQAKEGFVYFRP